MTVALDSAAVRLRRAASIMTGVFVLMAFLVGTFVVAPSLQRRARPFDPLQFPLQHILSRVPGIPGPAVNVGRPIRVTSQKCSLAQTPVTVTGRYSWQSAIPPGAIVPVGEGTAKRQPGCEQFNFVNPMPAGVIAAARAFGGTSTWIITGSETPTVARGVKRVWTTEPFTIVAP